MTKKISAHPFSTVRSRVVAVAAASLMAATAVIAVPSMASADVTDDSGSVTALAGPTTADIVIGARIAYQRVPAGEADLNNPEYLEGVAFELYTPTADGPGEPTGLTCAIPAGAVDCTITVPDVGTGGANEGAQYYVVQTSAGASAYPIDILMTGTASRPDNLRYYPGVTPPVTANATIAFPTPGEGQLTNSGVIASGLDNPSIVPLCTTGSLSLAVQMDISGSVDGEQRMQYRDALQQMVAQLAGSRVDLYLTTFGSTSPVDGRASGPWALDNEDDVAAVLDDISDFTEAVPGDTQQTNWDLALRRIADAPQNFDALLMLTDGAPNQVSNAAGDGGEYVSGSEVTIASVEQAVFSANAVKAKGTRVIAMGIGNGVSGDVYHNLAAISGPVAESDYYQGEWETLTEDLKNVITPLVCSTPVTLEKYVVDPTTGEPALADGWSFGAEVSDVSAGTATLYGDSPQVTGSGDNSTGEATWNVIFDDVAATATLTLTETGQPGYSLVGVDYEITHEDGTSTTGTSTDPALVLTGLAPTDSVDVAYTNAVDPSAATFQVRKVITGSGASLVPSTTPFSFTYSVNGTPAAAPLVVYPNGTAVDGPVLAPGDVVTITESSSLPAVSGVAWGDLPAAQTITLDASTVGVVTFTNTATSLTPANTGGNGGSLAATGADLSSVPPFAGAGVLVLLAGVLTLVITRRREQTANRNS
ncbi:VWA domain-containing protein [Herbiconiux daphne]|uniref:VWA domain-containing protein n=1 Tax=Herbiconiux daphne TaxID=2970914 RepID=A0ABT2H6M5_9MICO|nr:VWA domain-containing protein [Herbiconiux daphne]MCS5735591.1 VWA domain-containing protein [Herbiconiux daphne]